MKIDFDSKITAIDAANFLEIPMFSMHRMIKTESLEVQKSNNSVYFGHKTAKKIFKDIFFKKRVISFQIVKGGTGKTSLSQAFAIRANLYGAKVLCIDLDQQGNLSQAFNIDPTELPVMIDVIDNKADIKEAIVRVSDGLDVIPSRIENAILDNYIMLNKCPLDKVYMDYVEELIKEYDLIVIDCPPALGQSVTAATLCSDTIICPLTPDQFSMSGLEISYNEIDTINKRFKSSCNVKIVINKFDTRTILSNQVLTSIMSNQRMKNALYNTLIRVCQDFPNSTLTKNNIFSNVKKSVAKEDIDLFTREVLELKPLKKNIGV
jgi:chromosome partitioning protein